MYSSMNERAMEIATLAADYDYFDEATRRLEFVDLFNVIDCEVCGVELCALNVGRFAVSRKELESVGLTHRSRPEEEVAYSELHGGSTCSDCCHTTVVERPMGRAR